jgi:hypothetical protein
MSLRFIFTPLSFRKSQEGFRFEKVNFIPSDACGKENSFYINQQIYLSTQQSQDSQQLIS